LEVVRHADAPAFAARALGLLLADEARHNVMLGLFATLERDPGFYESYSAWTVEHGGAAVGAASVTPPFNLLLARPWAPGAVEALAEALAAEGVELPGVTAAQPEVAAFAEAWERLTGRAHRVRVEQGIYRLTEPVVPEGVEGGFRLARPADRPLLVRWWEAFAAEAMPPDAPHHDAEAAVDRRLSRDGGAGVWEVDGEVVAMAGFGSETPNGARIGPVYTPPEHRRRGYGSALTAHLSRHLIAGGRRFCFLYTDLANPTSNGIYRTVGYELVCESADLAFDP
jgi:ribosomal protein S18 acetylase RimI-like enzyme